MRGFMPGYRCLAPAHVSTPCRAQKDRERKKKFEAAAKAAATGKRFSLANLVSDMAKKRLNQGVCGTYGGRHKRGPSITVSCVVPSEKLDVYTWGAGDCGQCGDGRVVCYV